MKLKIREINALQWVLEPLESSPDFLQKKMFGCEAAYLGGRLMLVLADGEEPWNGMMVPTEREFHESIRRELPPLSSHPVLGKWLYISQSDPEFEEVAAKVTRLIQRRDPRFGVEPKPRKARGTRGKKAKK